MKINENSMTPQKWLLFVSKLMMFKIIFINVSTISIRYVLETLAYHKMLGFKCYGRH